MKKDDEFALKNEEYDDDARAVKESELLPIFEAMDFSGDIQPLEDFETPEPIATDLQSKKRQEGKISETKELIKKKIPFISGSNKIFRALLVTVASLLAVGIVILGVKGFIRSRQNDSPVGMIYSSDKTTFIRLENEDTFKTDDIKDVKVSADGMKIFYSVNTKSKIGKYDIRYIDVTKRSSLKNGGGLVCSGVDEGWSVNNDGTFLCYSTSVSGLKQCYFYSVADMKAKQLPSGIVEMFLPSSGDVIYFTRQNGSIYSLHRMRYGEDASNVASEISHVKFCDSADGFEVIYTVASEQEQTFDVYSVKNIESPSQICSAASEVYLNDYSFGGNLYYFKSSNAAVDWHDFVNDPYYEKDMTLERPSEGDYMKEYGFIIKRYILDKSAYNNAVAAYENKLKRDAIREKLDKIDFDLAFDGEYTCNVYNQYTNKILATGVSLNNVLSFADNGIPRVILRKSVIKVENKFDMNELVKYADRSNAESASDYVRDNVRKSYETSNDCVYAWFDGNKVITGTISDYKGKDTEFYMSSGLSVYALSGRKLYCTKVENAQIKPRALVAENVAECEVSGDCIYYRTTDIDEHSTLYRFGAEANAEKIADNIFDYIIMNNGSVMAFSQEADGTITVGSYADGKYNKIAENIAMEHFVRNGNTVAYINLSGESKTANAGDLYYCTSGGSPIKCESDVTNLKYIKDNLSAKTISES
ncbi:MAG: hypothetical protein MJ168_03830 [Clostridia bacterium]|nr:hypothetical protein [Clostridia bacterium]